MNVGTFHEHFLLTEFSCSNMVTVYVLQPWILATQRRLVMIDLLLVYYGGMYIFRSKLRNEAESTPEPAAL